MNWWSTYLVDPHTHTQLTYVEFPSETGPEVSLLDNSKSCQVDNQP